jgi:hypothetical protein
MPLVVDDTASMPVLPHILMVHLAWAWVLITLYQPFSKVRSDSDPTTEHNFGALAMTVSNHKSLRVLCHGVCD